MLQKKKTPAKHMAEGKYEVHSMLEGDKQRTRGSLRKKKIHRDRGEEEIKKSRD